MDVVDSLTHITPDGRWFSTSLDASEDALLQQMDQSKTHRAVVVALSEVCSNSFVLEACRRHKDRLLPVGSFNPSAFPLNSVAQEARAQLRDQGFVGVKLHPRLNRYDPLEPRVLAFLQEISSWDPPLPIWLCTYLNFPGAVPFRPVVEVLAELVSRYPSLPFILAHGGGPDILRLAHAVRPFSNASIDISFTHSKFVGSSVETDLRYLLKTFDRRLIYGSDFPEIPLTQARIDFERLVAGSKPSVRDLVLGANLIEVLRYVSNA